MIKHSCIAAAIAMAFSAGAFAEGTSPEKSGPAASKAPAAAASRCDTLAGREKDLCQQSEARGAAERGATGATRGSGSGQAGAADGARKSHEPAPSGNARP